MKIKILDFISDEKGSRKAFVDFKVEYSSNKWEIFRNVGYFEKENKKWLNIQNCKRDDKWISLYEREPSLKLIFNEVLKALKDQKPDEITVSVFPNF